MAAQRPQLLIIAGPNGAGKSTHSWAISPAGADVFDPDQELANVRTRFPELPNKSIFLAYQQILFDRMEDAARSRKHFTIETNFRDHDLMDIVEWFRKTGYHIHLMYVALRSVPQSIDRVTHRVENGGHFVDRASIEYNFTEGLKNLAFFADRFDALEVYDGSGPAVATVPFLYRVGKSLISIQSELPEKLRHTLKDIARGSKL